MVEYPLVSIIIPTYNREEFIRNSIISAANQTYKNIEIIVIDDGSTDNTGCIVKQIQQNTDIKIYYYYQKNSGVSSARNFGIEKANGEYIAFLDSDDQWDCSKLEKQMARIVEIGAQVCYCGTIRHFVKDGRKKKINNSFREGRILFDILKDYTNAETITWVIKKQVLAENRIRFYEGCNYGEDMELFLKIATLCEVCCVKEYLCYYTMHETSLVHDAANQFQAKEMWGRYKKWLRNTKIVNYNAEKIMVIMDRYTIPSGLLRILFDYKNYKGFCPSDFNTQLKKYENHVQKLNIFLGAHKIRLLLFKWCVYNNKVNRLVNFLRNLRNEFHAGKSK